MKKIFTHPETWLGGFHELAMEFDQPSTELCNSAMSALWDYPDLKGCYRDPASEPHEQNIIVPSWTALDAYGHLRGVLRLEGQDVACGCYAIKEDNGPVWLGFYVPMGALEIAYIHLGSSYHEMGEWREALDETLAAIGRSVFQRAPFSLGLIGLEVSADADAKSLKQTGIPGQRLVGYLWPQEGKLTYYPANQRPAQPKRAVSGYG